jgi:hypothetical protein
MFGGLSMFVAHIKSPRCQKCEDTMLLRLIEPERPGFDAQTFECQKCFLSETFVVSISGADVSTAMSLASRTTPPPCSRYYQARIVSRLRGPTPRIVHPTT